MNMKEFATTIQNETELLVKQENNKIIIEALEEELNHELEEVTADIQFIDNLQADRIDELTVIVTEVE